MPARADYGPQHNVSATYTIAMLGFCTAITSVCQEVSSKFYSRREVVALSPQIREYGKASQLQTLGMEEERRGQETMRGMEQERMRVVEQERMRVVEQERMRVVEQERMRVMEQEKIRVVEQERVRVVE